MDFVRTGLSSEPNCDSEPDEGSDYGIVAFSHVPWRLMWRRPQQFMSRFARNHRVLFMEPTSFDLEAAEKPVLELDTVMSNLTVANVHLPESMRGAAQIDEVMRTYCRIAMESLNSDGDFDQPILWFYNPMDVSWALGHLPGRGIVYDCVDKHSQFRDVPLDLVVQEELLLSQADVVFTGSYELWLKKNPLHPNVHFVGCGVEFEHFQTAQESGPVPADVAGIPGPIVGWFGVIDERFDFDLLAKLSQLRPDYSFVLVGPVVDVDPSKLPLAPNIHWLGGRDHPLLPGYCRAFDACMMCFALNEATESTNPTKALEYLASGKPVISTPINDVVRQYADSMLIARTPEQFADAIDRALSRSDPEMTRMGIERAREANWESTVERMHRHIAIAVDGSRGAMESDDGTPLAGQREPAAFLSRLHQFPE